MNEIMVYSGTDVISIIRIKRAISRDNGFKYKIFSENEIDYCESKESPELFFGGRWCVKESFIKVLYKLQPTDTISFDEIIVRKENGTPELSLLGDARCVLEKSLPNNVQSYNISISISHDKVANISSASCIMAILT